MPNESTSLKKSIIIYFLV